MLTRLLNTILALLFLSIPISAISVDLTQEKKDTWYSVEYIIFKINTNEEHEAWGKEPFTPPESALSFDTIKPSDRIKPLTPKQLQLYGAYNRLKKIASYTPIKHEGWLQALNANDIARPIHVQKNGETESLNGTISFHRGRFLHIDLDLQLNEQGINPVTALVVDNQIEPMQATLYRLKQTRRIKTGELNYFDHPKFGVLLKVEKTTVPDKKVATTEPVQSKP